MKRRHINEFMKTRLANSGRAAGMGILYDDYSEEAFPSVNTDPRYCPDPKLGIAFAKEYGYY